MKTNTKKTKEDNKVKQAIDFVEELSWLIESNKKIGLSEIPSLLREKFFFENNSSINLDSYVPDNSNIHYLIGVLPKLFQDTRLFPKNEDISEFAEDVLRINVTRKDKRSRYEIIGLIVCNTSELNDKDLDAFVRYLSKIIHNSEKISELANVKHRTGFSWNEVIREMGEV